MNDNIGLTTVHHVFHSEPIVRGVTRQVGNEIDEFVTEALRNNLLGLPLDLAAINIARGRDAGIPSLNAARRQFYEATGDDQLRPYTSWADFVHHIKNPESLVNFIAAYGTHETITSASTLEGKRSAAMSLVFGGEGSPTDRLDFLNGNPGDTGRDSVDFWVGGLAEKKMPFGGFLGATFNFVFETQLEALQNGDRSTTCTAPPRRLDPAREHRRRERGRERLPARMTVGHSMYFSPPRSARSSPRAPVTTCRIPLAGRARHDFPRSSHRDHTTSRGNGHG